MLPGSIRDEPARIVTERFSTSLAPNDRITSLLAALKVLWPETYSGNGGVTTLGSW